MDHEHLSPAIPFDDPTMAPEPESSSADSVNGGVGEAGGTTSGWPEPEALGGELPPVDPFNVELMPLALRPLVEDTAERMQVPLDFPAITAVLCLAGATNRRASIQPKASDSTWTVTPNLWGGIIASPGLMKSPVLNAVTKPLARIEAEWHGAYKEAQDSYEYECEKDDLDQQIWRELYKSLRKQDKAVPERPEKSVIGPVQQRLITQDATAEKLHELLSKNPAGIMVIRDELSGWLATLDRPGREGERGFFLSAWNGDTPYSIDRIGRGSIHVEACCVSMLGGIQPARQRGYLADALQDGPLNDGLLQRFQLLVYPDISVDWKYVDRPPLPNALEMAEVVFRSIVSLDVEQAVRFRFDAGAQELFIAWLCELEGSVRGGDLHPALVSHLSKYRSLMPSLALLFELADGGSETVSLRHAQQAVAWCKYLASHARRVYSMIVSPDRRACLELAKHLERGWKRKEGMFSVREVYQNDWSGLNTPDQVRNALELLEDAAWVMRLEIKRANGRPTEMYAINPKLAEVTR